MSAPAHHRPLTTLINCTRCKNRLGSSLTTEKGTCYFMLHIGALCHWMLTFDSWGKTERAPYFTPHTQTSVPSIHFLVNLLDTGCQRRGTGRRDYQHYNILRPLVVQIGLQPSVHIHIHFFVLFLLIKLAADEWFCQWREHFSSRHNILFVFFSILCG